MDGAKIERAVVGLVLLNQLDALPACDGLTPGDFQDPLCRQTWRAILTNVETGKPVDSLAVLDTMLATGYSGTDREVTALVDDPPPGPHLAWYVEQLRETSCKRRIHDGAADVVSRSDNGEDQETLLLALTGIVQAERLRSKTNDLMRLDGQTILSEPPPPHEPVLCDLLDQHGLLEIVGPSKLRKTFVAYQLALSLAICRRVFGFDIPRCFRVGFYDMELSPADTGRRIWRMGRALGVKPEDVVDRLAVFNLAGHDDPRGVILKTAPEFDVLIVDPLYSLCDGPETIEFLRPALRFLRKLATARAAVFYVHHDAKGTPGERETRDRGSGSGITGRAVDARITLTPHRADPDNAIVMQFMCRSYATPPASSWMFLNDMFEADDRPAEPERLADRRVRATTHRLDEYTEPALKLLEKGPLQPRVFKAKVREVLGLSKHGADDLLATLTAEGGPARAWHDSGFPARYFIGLPSHEQSACLPALPLKAGGQTRPGKAGKAERESRETSPNTAGEQDA